MKVLFITRKYPPSTGGMELFALGLSKAMAEKTDLKLIKWGGQGRLKAVLVALPYLFVRSFMAMAKGGIDVIYVQDSVLAPIGFVLHKLFRKPYAVQIHGLDVTYENPLFKVVVPWAVKSANVVFCISQGTAEAAQNAGVPAEKLRIIPLAVYDEIYGRSTRKELLESLNLPENSQILLTVGRLVRRKGVAWFIDYVLPELAARYPRLVYLVVGEGRDRPNVERALRHGDIGHRVRLLGKAPGELLAAAYNGADVFVMPNIKVAGDVEGFGLVLLEASLCALPVVAADLQGIKDAVTNGKNGILVSPGKAEGFVEEIGGFLDDKKYAAKFGKQSRLYTLRNHQWSKIADRYVEVYEQIG